MKKLSRTVTNLEDDMNHILIIGAAGFIGTNLTITLAKDPNNTLTLVDTNLAFFKPLQRLGIANIRYVQNDLTPNSNFDDLLKNQDVVFHLVSTTSPTTSNQKISEEIERNVIFTSNLLQTCVSQKIKRVIFISSGGTVYGINAKCPIREDEQNYPISSYGFQKLSIEKLLYLYNYMYGLDYRIIRLANPYGPYQRPNGKLGAVTTFTFKAINGEPIEIFGDGSVIRDYIYIDDAITAVINISFSKTDLKIFNVGSGYGITLLQVISEIEKALNVKVNVKFLPSRKVDVPQNYLDVSRYESVFKERICKIDMVEGIKRTATFLSSHCSN